MTFRAWILLLALAVAVAAGAVGAAPASKPAVETGKPKAKDVKDAKEAFDAVAAAYMTNNWDGLQEAQKALQRYVGQLTQQQRGDLAYIRATAGDFRPSWWKACAGTSPAKIRTSIWGRTILCNYTPSDKLSVMVDPTKMTVTASWNPSYVDSTVAEDGKLAEEHHLTRGDIGEVVVWRDLGSGYIMTLLPAEAILTMAKDNQLLFLHLQSFYAELTTLYHCSPKARRTAMLLHGTAIREPANNGEGYIRACRAISSMFLTMVLEDPKKWPSIHLPDRVPDEAIEKTVGTLAYLGVSPNWTVEEDRLFREAIKDLLHANGDRAIKQRGKVLLPNKLPFMLMEPDDRPFQDKRDAWVKEKMQKAAK
jgi:hypothetical protein